MLSHPLRQPATRPSTASAPPFRDWAAEAAYPSHVGRAALAHTIGNAVEAAYRRGDLFAKRVALMDDWAAYRNQPVAQVVLLWHGRRGALAADADPGPTSVRLLECLTGRLSSRTRQARCRRPRAQPSDWLAC
jgi:hypothetical protein